MECAICFDKLGTENEETKLACGHNFHSECIVPWILDHYTCPICRFQYADPQENQQRERSSNQQVRETPAPVSITIEEPQRLVSPYIVRPAAFIAPYSWTITDKLLLALIIVVTLLLIRLIVIE